MRLTRSEDKARPSDLEKQTDENNCYKINQTTQNKISTPKQKNQPRKKQKSNKTDTDINIQ